MPNSEELLEANRQLTASVENLAGKVTNLEESNKALTRSNRHNKMGVIALTCGGLILLAVVAVLIYALVKVNDTADKANEASAQAVTAQQLAQLIQEYQTGICQAGNEGRKTEKELWDSLFAEDKALAEQQGTPITKAEQEALDRIFEKVKKAYPQRDCTKVKEGEVVTKP